MKARRDRLDRIVTDRGLAESREKAQALIMAGEVTVNGQKAAKSGQMAGLDAAIEVLHHPRFVSRGGLKLEAALQGFGIRPAGSVCLDIGSSTGGFTDCLLQHGATRVHAVDCGTAQLDWRLRSDARVIVHENTNARHLDFDAIGELADLAVCDVSFISVTLIFPALLALLTNAGEMVVLVKPQFEVGKGLVGAGGIVRDPELHLQSCEKVSAALRILGFTAALMDSPILGAEGNREFLLHARRG